MSSNILITGAAGYIGGSLVANFLASSNPMIRKENVVAAVRSEDQAEAMSRLGIKVIRLDMTDEKAVMESLLHHDISIAIHTASSLDPSLALNLITALSKQRELTGHETYFIHTSGLSAFYPNTGWPAGQTKDTGPVFETEKQLEESFPLRKTDVAVIEHAKAQGVTSFIVIPSTVYGKGSGEWNKLSVVLPVIVQASIAHKTVYKFPENIKVSGVHISDLTALYGRIVDKILTKEPIPSGERGYYFALGHDLHWWELLDRLARALHGRGLVTEPTTQIWPSDEVAAEALGVPAKFVQGLWNSGDDILAERPGAIGWKPKWNEERFLEHIDDEVQAVLDLGKAKSSLIGSLHEAAKG